MSITVKIPLTNPMCLRCHGHLGKELEPSFCQRILEKYPADKAQGYSIGEIRGMWVAF